MAAFALGMILVHFILLFTPVINYPVVMVIFTGLIVLLCIADIIIKKRYYNSPVLGIVALIPASILFLNWIRILITG
ncbi:MAG: hypothetical protein ACNA7U_04065 [Candidatus Izemoplasmataceae bacterium]|uniref:hypothetical protein n=1 Tax=Liberiplasma polymorphum TaxID=3374570 RepID=UPI003773926B